jgi:hypothetical protein
MRQPIIGLTLEAFIVKLLDNQTFSYEYQRVIYERRDDYNYPFTDVELQVLKKLADLTPQAVERVFNKKKIKKELFLDKLSKDEEQMKLLNTYFDKKIAGCLNLLRGQNVYWRVKASDHPGMLPYPVHAHALKMVYHFTKVDEGSEYWNLVNDRAKVKPGMTGLWQVSGRSQVGFKEMVLLDLYYVENQSLLFDLEILFATVPVVLFGRGAY